MSAPDSEPDRSDADDRAPRDEPAPLSLPLRLVAEALGTFGLVGVGTAAIVLEGGRSGWLGSVGIAAAFGLVVVAMILLFGRASGAHINPAVTLAFVCSGRLTRGDALPYVAAQCVGALGASVLVAQWALPDSALGATLPSVTTATAFAVEVLITGALVYAILRIVSRPGAVLNGIAWSVGGTVALLAFLAGPATGASMNPARSLGPALVSGRLDGLWLYFVAPSLGAWLAVAFCKRTAVDCCVGAASSEPCR